MTTPARGPMRGKTEAQEPREKLLAAAIDLFSADGYEPVSTGQIAAAAGLTQSMVHYHFGKKSRIWRAVIERLMYERGLAFPIADADLRDLDPLSRLKVIIRRFFAANAVDPNLNRILMHEGTARSARLRWLARRYMVAGYRFFDQAIDEAIEAGMIRPLPTADVTKIIVSVCAMTSSLSVLIDEIYNVDITRKEFLISHGDSIIEVILKGLEPQQIDQSN